jgi:integrase
VLLLPMHLSSGHDCSSDTSEKALSRTGTSVPPGRDAARHGPAARARRSLASHGGQAPLGLRGLADALGGAEAQLRTVRSARVGRGEPRALSHDEWARLLRMPDRGTRHGKRDLALLHLLGAAGLRRAEAAGLLVDAVDERRPCERPAAAPGDQGLYVGADTAVIRELAGHADIRTTTIYTAVNPGRLEHAVAERADRRGGARRAAAGR